MNAVIGNNEVIKNNWEHLVINLLSLKILCFIIVVLSVKKHVFVDFNGDLI